MTSVLSGPLKRRVTVFVVALAARVTAIHFSGTNEIHFGDSLDYIDTARTICVEKRYPDRGRLPFFRAPLLPLFIAAVSGCQHERVVRTKFGLATLDSATAVFIGEITLLVFASPAAALVAGLAAALDPFFVAGTSDIRTEPLAMFLAAAGFLCVAGVLSGRWEEPSGCAACIAALGAAAFAACALARPVALIAVTLVPFALFSARTSMRRRWTTALAALAGAVVILAPWTIRNALQYHELILVNDASGFNFWRGSHPEMDRISRIEDPAEYRRAATAFEERVTPEAALRIEAGTTGPAERSRRWAAAAFRNVAEHPREAALFAAKRAARFWSPWLNGQVYPGIYVAASGALNLLLFGFAAWGMALAWPERRVLVVSTLVWFAAIWLAHIPFQVVMRFRIPFTDPLLIAFAAGAICHLGRKTVRDPIEGTPSVYFPNPISRSPRVSRRLP